MIRKLAFALSLLSVCVAGVVHALGLGEATVKSSLNQPLNAEIKLVNVGDLSAEEVLPGLATREEFLRAGVDRVYFLSDLRFEVKDKGDGNLVVNLTTKKPVREPFLNFLVEVIWPSGRLLREYALLIDPPIFTEAKPKAIEAPVTQSTPAQKVTGDVVSMPAVSQRSVASSSQNVQIGGEYGPTDSNDTLWDIAIKARPDRSVSPQQVMLAIQDLNPDAFINGNINKMKTGQVLRLPTKDQIKKRSTMEAINAVIAQNEALQPKRKKAIVSTAKLQSPKTQQAKASAAEDELKLVVADQAQSANTSTSNSGAADGTGAGPAQANAELAITREKLDKATIENSELNGRVSDLEEQLQTLQRLLTLKNDQLASFQKQMQENELERLNVQESQATIDAAAVETEQQEDEPGDQMTDVSAHDVEKSEVVDENAAKDKQAIAEVSKPAAKHDTPKATTVDAPSDNEADSENIIQLILSNPIYLAAVSAGVLLLVGLFWWVSRANAAREVEYQRDYDEDDTSFDTIPGEEGADSTSEEASFDEVSDSETGSFEDDEVIDDVEGGSLDSDSEGGEPEEDVIAEADVYIAYGRLDQAARLLEEAISQEPVRTDLRLKLLEVYKESNDTEAFERQFGELEAIQDSAALEEATQIRSEMLDGDLLSLEDKEQALVDERSSQADVSSLTGHEDELQSEEQAIENEENNSFDFEPVEQSEELDIDLDSEELDVDLDIDLNVDETASIDEDAGLDLELSASEELSLSDDASQEAEVDVSTGLEVDDEVLEASLNEVLGEMESDQAALVEDEGLDAALEDVDLTDELDQEKEIELPESLDLGESAENEGLQGVTEESVVSDEILEEAVEEIGASEDFDSELGDSDLSESEDFDFLEGTDEASTKLDLARAYIDMGDIEGARDILEEVQKEGSEDQKAEASDLLNSLDS